MKRRPGWIKVTSECIAGYGSTTRTVTHQRARPEALAANEQWLLDGYSLRERRAWLQRRRARTNAWAVQDGLRDLLRRYE